MHGSPEPVTFLFTEKQFRELVKNRLAGRTPRDGKSFRDIMDSLMRRSLFKTERNISNQSVLASLPLLF